jgi:glutaredoxin
VSERARVRIFTRPACLLCAQVRDQLTRAGVAFDVEELTTPAAQESAARRFGAVSFPLILVNGRYVGGFTHLMHLMATGRLAEWLARER